MANPEIDVFNPAVVTSNPADGGPKLNVGTTEPLEGYRCGHTGIIGPITLEKEFGRLTGRNKPGTSPLTGITPSFSTPGGVLMIPTRKRKIHGKP